MTPASIAARLAGHAWPKIIARGREYAQDGHVVALVGTPAAVEVLVAGSAPYRVTLSDVSDEGYATIEATVCTCPMATEDHSAACKHMIAAALAWDTACGRPIPEHVRARGTRPDDALVPLGGCAFPCTAMVPVHPVLDETTVPRLEITRWMATLNPEWLAYHLVRSAAVQEPAFTAGSLALRYHLEHPTPAALRTVLRLVEHLAPQAVQASTGTQALMPGWDSDWATLLREAGAVAAEVAANEVLDNEDRWRAFGVLHLAVAHLGIAVTEMGTRAAGRPAAVAALHQMLANYATAAAGVGPSAEALREWILDLGLAAAPGPIALGLAPFTSLLGHDDVALIQSMLQESGPARTTGIGAKRRAENDRARRRLDWDND